ncbi:MAG TPA: creatininase family protein [Ignisphaera aggregans]|uniref:Creatininase family protein n=1 Tax=Ignisphaera aggregans TaxID=334771 RepID=A0A833DUA4_9CREN|nr:creatininase family protein [Ignisphaera aggregans]
MFKRIPSHFVNWVCYAMSKPLSERFGKPILNKFGKKIYLDQMTMKEIEERVKENDIVILPVGSTEAHGPFAPVGEDTIIGVSIAERVAYETGVTVAPPIFYGSHPSHHYGLRGTIPVRATTLIEYVSDVIRWLANAGFKKIIVLNSHGQEYVLPIAKDIAIIEKGVHALILVTSWWMWVQDLLRKAGTGEEIAPGVKLEKPFIHADEVETSVVWYVAPELVDVELLKKEGRWGIVRIIPGKWVNAAGNVFPDKPFNWYDVSHAPELYYYPRGFVGWADKADPKKGEILVETAIKRMIEFIEWLKKTYPPGKIPRTWIEYEDYEFTKPREWVEPPEVVKE